MGKAKRPMPPVCSQQWIDLVDLAIHRAIVRKIRRQPRLFSRAKRTLARWERVRGGDSQGLREWKRILNQNDMEAILDTLTRVDEEGNRLRSTAPFCGILTEHETEAIWARHDAK